MKKYISIMFILAMIISLGLFSCESSSDDSGDSGTSELVGTWLFDFCDYDAVDVESETDKYVFPTTSSGSRTGYSYDQDGCISGNLMMEFVDNFTYQVGDTITTSDSDTAKKINLTTQSVWVTPRDATFASELNAFDTGAGLGRCGISDWAVDVAREITGLDCGTVAEPEVVDSQGTVKYDIYKVSGSKLYFGDDENDTYEGDTDANRPRKLEGGGYTKS